MKVKSILLLAFLAIAKGQQYDPTPCWNNCGAQDSDCRLVIDKPTCMRYRFECIESCNDLLSQG